MTEPMTRPWPQIVACYAKYTGDWRSIQALESLAQQITKSRLSAGLFAWTSMFDLCFVQTEVSYPYVGPALRISPVSKDQLEFRYEDTFVRSKQWHQTVDADDLGSRLLEFLDHLRWFSPEIITSSAAKLL
jgi:hypothetical protein